MIISTRGRYALRVMLDLAENGNGEYIAMKKIAERQGISLKYLEQILPVLTQNNIIEGISGKGGGYRLNREPKDYTVGSILKLTEGSLAAVSCTAQGPSACSRTTCCQTKPMWDKLDRMIDEFFEDITLANLLENNETV